jgi:hypothetical protein
MYHLSVTLNPRLLAVLLAILLLLLTVLFLVHAHLGGMPALVQSTEAILQ